MPADIFADSGHGFVHSINPVLFRVWSVECYYYGLAYALGFLGVHAWLRWRKKAIGWPTSEIYEFSILFALGALVFGRAFSVFVYHWEYYRVHLWQVPSYWRGGMASHGVLLGGVLGTWLFCRLRGKRFIEVADEVVIPAALFLALGRIGNFVNGQICGTPADVWWAVKFPNIEGFRHPVTLYQSLKNLLIIPILLLVRRASPPGNGKLAAHFVFWYGFLRMFTDCFREHGAKLLGIGRNQYFNAIMALVGLILMWVYSRTKEPLRDSTRQAVPSGPAIPAAEAPERLAVYLFLRATFLLILLFSLVVRSAWTQEVLDQKRAGRAAPAASWRLPQGVRFSR